MVTVELQCDWYSIQRISHELAGWSSSACSDIGSREVWHVRVLLRDWGQSWRLRSVVRASIFSFSFPFFFFFFFSFFLLHLIPCINDAGRSNQHRSN